MSDGPLPLVIGAIVPATAALAEALGAPLVAAPALPPPKGWDWSWKGAIDTWTAELEDRPQADHVVVCTWSAPAPPAPLADAGGTRWVTGVEQPLALWFATVVTAARCCADGGALVVVVERPAAIDAAGFAEATIVGEGLVTLTRSLGHAEGPRGVRVNAVVSQLTTVPEALAGLPPMVASFPGTADREVAGAVRLALSEDASGISGTALRADGGRSW